MFSQLGTYCLAVSRYARARPAVDRATAQPLPTPPTDYGRSVVTTAGMAGNQPAFWIESRCRSTDPATDEVRDNCQCASRKSEDTFAAHDLFDEKNG